MRYRWEWLADQIKTNGYKIGAEIGVFRGATTYQLMQSCPKLKLYAVDKWEYIDPDHPQAWEIGLAGKDLESVFRRFMLRVHRYKNRLIVIRGDSVDSASGFEDGSLDFVFIDADHRYEAALGDIKAWTPKVREGGIISGHDYNHSRFPGVIKAAHECFGDNVIDTRINYVWFAKREDYLL